MKLLLDVGNSRLKWAWLEERAFRAGAPLPSRAPDLAGALDAAWGKLPRPNKVLGCNVAGEEIGSALERWIAARWNCPCRWMASAAQAHGVVNGYEDPARLGADRWLALIAARRMVAGPLCVADCGTAITVDVLDGEGRHLGGVIAPGLAAMRRALPLAVPPGGDMADLLGRNTATAVASGVLHAAAGLVERVHSRSRALTGAEPVLIVTGGDGARIAHALDVPHRLEAELLLRGLAWLSTVE